MSESSFNSLTVIIPTYNRQELLAKALAGYLAQSAPNMIHELLVVDDGSTDGTESVVQEFSTRSPFPLRYLRQQKKGPAAARNLGIGETRSNLLLFTDSDIVPDRDLVNQHIEWHQANPQSSVAVLGYVTWSPEVRATPFMRWYGEDGPLFGYRWARGKREVDFRFFYTCNLSLKTGFLRSSGQFDEEFKSAAYEDTELGYRLSKQGLRLFYNPAAVGYHYQFFSFQDASRKARANAAAAELFFRREAGQHTLTDIRRKQSRSAYRVARFLAIGVAGALAPARLLLNSSVPLPRPIYHLFYWYDVNRVAQLAMQPVADERP